MRMNEENNIIYLFGKDLTDHIESTPTEKRYLALRIARFREEFLTNEATFDDIDDILHAVHDYMYQCEDCDELSNHLINLRQSIYWLHEFSER